MKKVGLIVCAVLMAVFCLTGCGPSTEDIAEQVKVSMSEKLGKEQIKVESVSLVHEDGNKYVGIAKLSAKGENKEVSIKVVCDGESFQWEIVE